MMSKLNPQNRMRPTSKKHSLISGMGDVLTFLLGMTVTTTVHFVGDLPVGEILVLALVLPIFTIYRNRALRPDLIIIYCLQAVWLLGQVLTDIYRRTPEIDWTRGDAAIVFFMMDLAFFAMLISGNKRRIIIFVTALAVGSIASTRLFPTEIAIESPWKFGYSQGVNLLCVLVSSFFCNSRKFLTTLALLLGIVAVNLAANFRSPVLFILITIALSVPVIPEHIGPWHVLPPAGSLRRLWVLIALAVGASLTASALVRGLSAAGYLGEDAQQKNAVQAQVKGGLLLGGRPEIVVSSRAVFDSPILGHGSWAKDYKYVEILHDVMRDYGLEQQEDLDSLESNDEGLIPSHSYLMGAWVAAGIAGPVVWFYLLWIELRLIFQLSLKRPPFSPLFIFLCVGNVWDMLFSPFGSSKRLIEAFLIIMTFDLLRDSDVSVKLPFRLRRNIWRRGQFTERVSTTAPTQ